MLLDEFCCMLKIKNFATVIEQAKGLNIQITIVVQNYQQLISIYGKEETEILKLCFGISYIII